MEVYFSATPTFEPIAHRPFIRKWVREKKTVACESNGHNYNPFLNNINKYLFYCLEEHNLELAYKLRYALEVAGYMPFYRHRDELDKALRRAKNRSYRLLEQLIDRICVEVDDLQEGQHKSLRQQLADRWGYSARTYSSKGEKEVSLSTDLLSAFQSEELLVLSGSTDWMKEYDLIYEWRTRKIGILGHDQLDAAWQQQQNRPKEEAINEAETFASKSKNKAGVSPKVGVDDSFSPTPEKPETDGEVAYDFSDFKLPQETEQQELEFDDSVVFEQEAKKDLHVARLSSTGLASSGKKIQETERPDLLADQKDIPKPKYVVPPPLYKFKAITKSSVTKAYDDEEASDPLIISQDSINRRITEKLEKSNFLEGSAFWEGFRKRDSDAYGYHDPNSLVIHQDCIDNRISNNNIDQKHALADSFHEAKAFEAFDSIFISPDDPLDEDQETWEEPETGELTFNNVAYRKEIKQLYQKSLQRYLKGDHTYFEMRPGRFFMERDENRSVYRWLQQLSQAIKELFSAFREGLNQAETDYFGEIQDFLVARLKKGDFPSYEAWTCFQELKTEAELRPLSQSNLIQILNGESGRVGGLTGCGSETLQNLFAPFVAEVPEIPNIQVRISELTESLPFLPIQRTASSREFLDSPKFTVRTSSDYQKSHALSAAKQLSAASKVAVSLDNPALKQSSRVYKKN